MNMLIRINLRGRELAWEEGKGRRRAEVEKEEGAAEKVGDDERER